MKKRIILLIFIVLYISLIISYLLSFRHTNFIMFGTTTYVFYNNNEIKSVKRVNKINKKIDYEKFKVFLDNSFKDLYINFYDQDNATYFKLYDEENQLIDTKKPLLAYKGNVKIKVSDSPIETELKQEEKDKLLKILKSHSINEDISLFSKQILDIDNDSQNEIIYSLSNVGSKINESVYTYIFIQESNNEIIDVDLTETKINNTITVPQTYLAYSVDLDNDNKYEIVLLKSTGDDTPAYYHFYKYDDSTKNVYEILK